ncbi:MAG: hypothetical protein HeimC3_38970 [Candidatus Heimdallarchaeota archaeon LC_3]|nr:MAG: hypothetical protein HeimC3_38970 [Candidatus Heimdallarchaeota archaeon LC_3]
MKNDEIISKMDKWINYIQKYDVEAELYAINSNVVETTFESNFIKSTSLTENSGLGIRIITPDKRVSFSCTNRLTNDDHIYKIFKKTVKMAKSSAVISYASLANPSAKKKQISIQENVPDPIENLNFSKELFDYIRNNDTRINIDLGNSIKGQALEIIASTNDLFLIDYTERTAWVVYAFAREGSTVTSGDICYDAVKGNNYSRDFSDIDLMKKNLMNQLRAKKINIDNDKKPITIFSPETLLEVIISPLLDAFDGSKIIRKESPFTDELGSELFHKDISLTDDGTIENCLGTVSFDREGNSPLKTSMIDKGVFLGILHNQFSANKSGQEPTGHASGSYRSQPNITSHNLNLSIRNSTEYINMIESIDYGVLINGIASYPDFVSGEIQGSIKNSYLITKGKLTPLKELNIAGNIYNNLKNNLVFSSKEVKVIKLLYSEFSIPWVGFEGFSLIN